MFWITIKKNKGITTLNMTCMRPRIFIPFYEFMKILLKAENETHFYIDNVPKRKPCETFVKSFVNYSISRFVFRSYRRPVCSVFVYSHLPPPPRSFRNTAISCINRKKLAWEFQYMDVDIRSKIVKSLLFKFISGRARCSETNSSLDHYNRTHPAAVFKEVVYISVVNRKHVERGKNAVLPILNYSYLPYRTNGVRRGQGRSIVRRGNQCIKLR